MSVRIVVLLHFQRIFFPTAFFKTVHARVNGGVWNDLPGSEQNVSSGEIPVHEAALLQILHTGSDLTRPQPQLVAERAFLVT